jgi:hypothetical protein
LRGGLRPWFVRRWLLGWSERWEWCGAVSGDRVSNVEDVLEVCCWCCDQYEFEKGMRRFANKLLLWRL